MPLPRTFLAQVTQEPVTTPSPSTASSFANNIVSAQHTLSGVETPDPLRESLVISASTMPHAIEAANGTLGDST